MSLVAATEDGTATAAADAPAKWQLWSIKWWLIGTGTLAFAGLVGFFAPHPAPLAPAAPKAVAAAAAEDDWIPADQPAREFSLGDVSVTTYDVRLNTASGGRMDTLATGTLGAPDGAARLTIYRPGDETVPTSTLFVELVRRASDAGLAVLRSANPVEIATRFGPFEAAEVEVSDGKVNVSCLGFRRIAADEPALIDGFVCGGEKPPEAARAACLIDGLALAGPQEDAALQGFFAPSHRQPTLCANASQAAVETPMADAESVPLPPERPLERRRRVVR